MLHHAYGLYRPHKYKACRDEYGTGFVQLSSALCYILRFWSKLLFSIFISDTVIYILNLGGLAH